MKHPILTLFIATSLFACKKEEAAKPEEVAATGSVVIYTTKYNTADCILYFEDGTSKNIKSAHKSPGCGAENFITIERPAGTYYLHVYIPKKMLHIDSVRIDIEPATCKPYDFKD